jgi:MoaA/NifB/PqqE/SkfB family radical SAM enzyme
MGRLTTRFIDEAQYVTKGGRLLRRFWSAKPFLLNWQITYRCNFKCDICSFWRDAHGTADELDLEQVRTVAQRLQPLGPLIISMAGGEPLIRKDLPDIAQILSRDHYFTIISNGWYLTAELARRLYDSGLQDAHISIDYADPGRHDAMRKRQGSFDRALRAVELLRDARPNRRHRVHIMAVLLDDNIDDIEQLIELAEDLGVSVELSLYSHGRGRRPIRYPDRPVAERLVQLKKKHPSTFVSMSEYLAGFDRAVDGDGIPECHAGKTFFNIDDRGRVSRCIDTNDLPVGNLLDEPLEPLVDRLATQGQTHPCAECWTSCRGFGDIIAGPGNLVRTLGDFYQVVRPL